MKKGKDGFYYRYIKRVLDFFLSLFGLIVLSPALLTFTIIGAIAMKGTPFFTQARPGKDKKIFKLIKFRTMTNEKDEDGNLLTDAKRLNRYGRLLRSTSIDELLELICILKGDMSIVGPRPLAVQYLPYYNDEENKRHSVLPGLTGLAQINGRNIVNWPDRFRYDVEYVNSVSFRLDTAIVLRTILKVIKRSDVTVHGTGEVIDFDKFRIRELKERDDAVACKNRNESSFSAV